MSDSGIGGSDLHDGPVINDHKDARSELSPAPYTNGVVHDDDFEESPRKRRKFSESTIRKPSPPRPMSPPWKKVVVDGPTSFVENGRRKSGRTNIIPLDLQPPSKKRTTRRTATQAATSIKSRYGGAALRTLSLSPKASKHAPHVKRPYHRKIKSPDKAATPSKLSTHHRMPKSAPESSPDKKRRGRPPRAQALEESSRKHANSLVKRPQTPLLATRKSSRKSSSRYKDEIQSEDEQYQNTTTTPSPLKRTPKLKFRVRMPELPLVSIHNVPKPREYSSFREWFEKSPIVKEETSQMTRDDAVKEGQMRQRLIQAAEVGGVLSEERCSVYQPDKEEEPARQFAQRDHLISQALHFRSLMNTEHRRHVNEAKRMATAAAAEALRRRPKSAEEIEQEARDLAVAVYKQIMKDMIYKWSKVSTYVNDRRLEKWEKEQEELHQQALDNVLEHSSRLMDARRSNIHGNDISDEDDVDEKDEEDELSHSDNEKSSSESADDSNMSSEDTEDEEEEDVILIDAEDEGLSIEELQKKYADRIQQASESPRESSPDKDIMDVEESEPEDFSISNLLSDAGKKLAPPIEIDVENTQIDDVDDALMDDSEESTDMEGDMGDSDMSSEEDKDEDNQDEAEYDQDESHLSMNALVDGDPGSETSKALEISKRHETPEARDNFAGFHVDPLEDVDQVMTNDIHETSNDNLSSQASPGTFTTTKHSEPDSRSSIELHDSRHASSATTPQPLYHPKTAVPFLLRGSLREYQHYGLDWLSNLYVNRTNGILADEMGLGKTIQTIALLAHLACVHEVWGPHLIVVPTSVMLNWEMEFKKWCPGFKILTYYGDQNRRRELRRGWNDDNKWHVIITSYQLVLQDQQTFKRRNWHYMILDEAHHIKNFQSQKWQALLTFKTKARLLLTGTPLQNGLDELWALLFFLMPTAEVGKIGEFASRQEFANWFQEIGVQIVDKGAQDLDNRAKAAVADLHKILRPFLLRRLKADVEKQMPPKFEHIINSRLSKRQRQLYDEFMSRSSTKDALIRGNTFSIMNCVMSLRKVCNHPDLFETRQIVTSYAMKRSAIADYEIKEFFIRRRVLAQEDKDAVNLNFLGLLPASYERSSKSNFERSNELTAIKILGSLCRSAKTQLDDLNNSDFDSAPHAATFAGMFERKSDLQHLESMYERQWGQLQKRPIYGDGLRSFLTLSLDVLRPNSGRNIVRKHTSPKQLYGMVSSLTQRSAEFDTTIQKFAFVTPPVYVEGMNEMSLTPNQRDTIEQVRETCRDDAFHESRVRLSIAFPDKRLLQYDCGKLQQLDRLLRELQAGGHRALIFTQMTKVLDLLEQFMNIHGHRYLRLDGQTKIEQRQILTERFNSDPRILAFILSSRSGGLGINLTGADTVIFYDLDWNPSADKQCQDRCHRIGQTREVHIYRLVSESTIESNILRKANQKRLLDNVVIQEGDFTTDYFNKLSVRDVLGDDIADLGDAKFSNPAMDQAMNGGGMELEKVLEKVEDIEDVQAAKVAKDEKDEEVHADEVEFAEKDASNDQEASANNGRPLALHERDPTGIVVVDPRSGNVLGAPEKAIVLPEPEHLDEYLIRSMERELQDQPLQIPLEKLKRHKKSAHRVKRNKA